MQNKILDIVLAICIVLLISILIIGPDKIKFSNLSITMPKEERKLVNNQPSETSRKEPENNIEDTEENKEENNHYDQFFTIDVNKEISLSGKSKEEIYKIRKLYVRKSIFKSPDYEPSDAVFSQIEDYKPWLASLRKKYGNICETSGPSAQSRSIVNPSILVNLDWPYYWDNLSDNDYTLTFSLLPVILRYNPAKKEIIAVYSRLPITTPNPYTLNGINARDFGYNYAYIDLSKSQNIPSFNQNPNITNSVIEFRDFFHKGGSCGVEGGCNNWSPYQPYLSFQYSRDDYYLKNELYIKLWKDRPFSPNDPADITEKIIILPGTPKKGKV